ncbi:hypothetical protein D3C80_2183190 [compost metagenome]
MIADETQDACRIRMSKSVNRLVEIPNDMHLHAQPEQALQDGQLPNRKILAFIDNQKRITKGQSPVKGR